VTPAGATPALLRVLSLDLSPQCGNPRLGLLGDFRWCSSDVGALKVGVAGLVGRRTTGGLRRKLCLVGTRRAATTFRLRFSFLKAQPRRPLVCVFVGVVEALCHSAWLGGVGAIVALGVCFLPEFGVVDLCSWRRIGAASCGVCEAWQRWRAVILFLASVSGFRRRRVALAVCGSSWGVGAARPLCLSLATMTLDVFVCVRLLLSRWFVRAFTGFSTVRPV
jgi:hypothetical protein